MADLCKFQKEQRFVSYDGGITWSPLQEFRKGQLIEYASPDCGDVGDMYRWALIDNDYICIGKDKYTKLVFQVSYDGGSSWYNVYPSQFKAGDLVERNSDFCDNASEGHYSGSTSHIIIDPVWVIKCDEYGVVLTSNDIHRGGVCLTSITITDCVIGIDDGAFSGVCLSDITIPSSVISIGELAFSGCSNLCEVYLPNSIRTIGSGAFRECTNLEAISIPNQLSVLSPYLFGYCYGLNNIIIPSSISTIGDHAFYGCSGLTNVTINEGVSSIGDYAFSGCNNITYLSMPNTIETIGDSTFRNCTNLSSINIPDSVSFIGDYAFQGCTNLSRIVISNASIGDYAFSGCTNISNVEIQGNSIGNHAFATCTSISSVTIGSGVTEIYYDSFAGSPITTLYTDSNASLNLGRRLVDNSLTSVVIGNNVSSIGDSAFANCGNLSSVTIGNSVTSIGDTAFAECSGLTSIVIPEGVISIGYGAFLQSHINHLIFPSSITTLGNVLSRYAEEYTLLSLVPPTIHRPVTNDGTFNGATIINVPCQSFGLYYEDTNYSSYKSILNPIGQCDNVRWVDDGEECISGSLYTRQVLEYRISEQSEWKATDRYRVTGSSIGDCHYKLTITNVQGNVSNVPCDENNYISSSDFNNYTNIKTVEIGACVTTISAKTFYNSSKTSGKFTAMTDVDMSEVQTIGASAFTNCASISSVTIPNGVTSIGSYTFYNCTSLTSITIPNGVTSIGTSAFRYCSGLTSVTIPSSVTSIGNNAFNSCTGLIEIYYNAQCGLDSSIKGWGNALKKVVIGDSTPSIGYAVFSDCGSLSSVTIGSGVTSIGNYAFENCSGLTSVTIPNSVTSIGQSAFYGCSSLTTCTIGNGVTSIGERVFQYCSGLTSVTVEATTPPTIGTYAFYQANDCQIYVPSGSVNAYKTASGWRDYSSRIQAIP